MKPPKGGFMEAWNACEAVSAAWNACEAVSAAWNACEAVSAGTDDLYIALPLNISCCYMIQLCLAEKDKASMQRCFPLQNRECGQSLR